MSVGGRDPKTQGTPPVPVARSRVDTRPMHKVSFKLTKPKPSKIKYLTQSEIIGICISILISFGISIIVVSIGINVVPVILRKTVEIVKELADIAKGNMDRAVQKPPTYSRYLTVHSDLNCNTFSSEYEDKDPVLFETTSWVKIPESGVETTCGSVLESHTIDLRPFEVFADMAPDIENAPGMEMTVNQFMKGEFTLNSDMENGNHWAFTTNRNALPQQLLPAGLKLPLSLSTAAHESDTCATHSHPLADFVPVSLAWARNTSELSGGPFHAHTRSVSLLLQGRKRWVLFPPGQLPPGGFSESENLHDWRTTVQPTLTASGVRPVEAYQEAGQALYIPEGWYHASQTLSEVSVSTRFSPPDELPGVYHYYLVRGDRKAAVGDFAAAVKMYRVGLAMCKDLSLVVRMGVALEKLGLYAEAEAAYTEAVVRNPRNAKHYVRLANLLVSHSSSASSSSAAVDSSVAVGNLLQRAESFGLKAHVLKLLKDAF